MSAIIKAERYLLLDGVSSYDLLLVEIDKMGRQIRKKSIVNGVRTEYLLPSLTKFMRQNRGEVKGLVVVQGLGSFTQTRLVCAVANALAYGKKVPIAKVSAPWSLDSLFKQWKKLKWQNRLLPDYNGPAVS